MSALVTSMPGSSLSAADASVGDASVGNAAAGAASACAAATGAAGASAAGSGGRALCPICPHACRLAQEQLGVCGARQALNGKVVAANYGQLTALALDPIEKKPLAEFCPGSTILSVGSYGCNLNCPFCQNSDIARMRALSPARPVTFHSPKDIVEAALGLQSRGNIGIAYTYNEPLVSYEFVMDTAALAHQAGLKNVLVSNGYVNAAPFAKLLGLLDAANIDLKGFNQGFYDLVGAPQGLAAVKHSIQMAAEAIHLEVTTLIIPGLNDSREEVAALAQWLAGINPEIPLHLSRFHPAHRMLDRPPTPRQTIRELAEVARQHLHSIYMGNM